MGHDERLAALEAEVSALLGAAGSDAGAGAGAGAGAATSTGGGAGTASTAPTPKLGAAYNVFDGEELLEASIRSIRPTVSFVAVVYQTVSNFGDSNSGLTAFLEGLRDSGLVDRLIPYSPRSFTGPEKKALVSPRTTGADLGGAKAEDVGDQFINELCKRELGRQACLDADCTHFMSLDVDEFYHRDALAAAHERMMKGDYHVGVCRMRFYFRSPQWELKPLDDLNYVPCMYVCDPDMPFKVGCPYPFLIDPTRKLHKATRVLEFKRSELEMHHYSFVRADIRRKIMNVSNRGNYQSQERMLRFAQQFEMWRPGMPLIHPHPYFKELFSRVEIVDNFFDISVGVVEGYDPAAMCANNCGSVGKNRCGGCGKVRYCGVKCQRRHWKQHKASCAKKKAK